MKKNIITFQEIITKLQNFWINNGCNIIQPFDIEIGAATLHPITYLFGLKKKEFYFVYTQSCRRPFDSRYNINNFKISKYFQLQIIMRPKINNIQKIYLESLCNIGINFLENDIKFIEDNWENTTLGSWGIGCEVQLNGIEITQITYFKQICGIDCNPVILEITYGLERLSMILQKTNNIYNLIWSINKNNKVLKYKDINCYDELEYSLYNTKYANKKFLFIKFNQYELEIKYLLSLKKPLLIPAYECLLKVIHNFNLLESRNSISIYERQSYILRIQSLSKKISKIYYELNQ
ncbi:glycine--tRNA ligase subunit alpha [endosymbiont of Pachyrhynchus infernalis]|uniref:glycine--tRNA ligase subunit alpha n=1 Tax=endosymbiont of Pachyrhynchus infernalis TaxID=1971488 RepID=UPI000DC7022C|nr:glycine--tRNA ligase subunit alpha [endosymbiont of Pachyrhynchus infernalis]BBA84790.1 glycine--tRNA ligase alpha subunit [endosymbiont of Pachyrhynchus infernalis]